MTIGQRIKKRRKEMKMSADELGKRLGKDRSTIYRYEKGDIENLPLDVLEPIADALETTPAFLMGWEKKVEEKNDTTGATNLQDGADYDFGDAVPFQLKGTLPANYNGYGTYYYCFVDNLSSGLSFNEGSVKVYVADADVTDIMAAGVEKTDITTAFTLTATSTGFELKCNNLKTSVGSLDKNNPVAIFVRYTAIWPQDITHTHDVGISTVKRIVYRSKFLLKWILCMVVMICNIRIDRILEICSIVVVVTHYKEGRNIICLRDGKHIAHIVHILDLLV